MPAKPTGQLGPISITLGSQGPAGGWKRIEFPKDKGGVERFIVNRFCSVWKEQGVSISKVTQNPEDNFDFTLELAGGTVWLDLVEIIYRDSKAPPYEKGEIEIMTFPFAEQIRDAVMKKSEHYGRAATRPIHLLMYTTHWRFSPCEEVIRLVQHFLQVRPPIMENVFLLIPFDEKDATLRVLFPSRNPLEGHDPDEFREHSCLILDPEKGMIIGG